MRLRELADSLGVSGCIGRSGDLSGWWPTALTAAVAYYRHAGADVSLITGRPGTCSSEHRLVKIERTKAWGMECRWRRVNDVKSRLSKFLLRNQRVAY